MLRVVYSNATEELLAALCRDLEAARRRPGARLLEPIHLVVPDRHVETYVTLGVARLTGLCANLRVHYLKRFLAAAVAGGATPPVRVVDAATLQGLVLAALLDDATLADDALAAPRDYLHAVDDEAAVDLRRYQLSVRLARLFEEYDLARPSLLAAWRAGRLVTGAAGAATERWQRRLWLKVFGPGGLLARQAAPGERWVTFAELLEPAGAALLQAAAPPRAYLFGFSYLAATFVRLLGALAPRGALHLYTVAPCREAPAELLAPAAGPPEDPFALDDPAAPALRRWGRPGREFLRLLAALPGVELRPAGRDPAAGGAPSLLTTLQRDVVAGAAPAGPAVVADTSVSLHACASVRREAEMVATEIWELVRRDPGLRFPEIAVIVAGRDPEASLTHLAAAFRECHDLPHSIADLPLRADSRPVGAVAQLLALPFGTFTRPEVLRLATHPAVLARCCPEARPDDWVRWSAELGIVHGADHADHAATYVTRDLLNWDQGLRRLALGVFMAGARSGEERRFALGAEEYAPHEVGDGAAAARFALLVRSLVADARALRRARLPLAAWAELLGDLVATYVGASDAGEERELDRCLAQLRGLDLPGLGERPLSYRLAAELARAALAGLGASRGHPFADGVVVSTFRPMRALPFKVTFIVGLGEGEFPAPTTVDHLDLRRLTPAPGDVAPRARDAAMFLETVLSTRQRLVLSYVGRDPLTGDELQPSSLVVELLHDLDDRLLRRPGAARAALVTAHPLRRWHPRYFPDLGAAAPPAPLPTHLPEARREAQTVVLATDLRAHAGPAAFAARAELAAALPAAVRGHLRLVDPPAPAPVPAAAPAVRRISLTTLRRFLECPLQGYARHVLGLTDDEEDLLASEDEAFTMDFLAMIGFLREVMAEALVGGRDPLVEYQRRAAAREESGALPTGLFGEVERAAHRERLATWLAQVPPGADGGLPAVRTVRFGGAPPGPRAAADEVRAPLVLELELDPAAGLPPRLRVEVTGRTAPLIAGTTSLLFSVRGSAGGESGQVGTLKEALRAFLDHALLTAAGEGAPGPVTAHVCLQGAGSAVPVRFAPFATAAAARAYLGGLITDLVTRPHDYLLPVEAVLRCHLRGGGSLAEQVEAVLAGTVCSTHHGPVTRWDECRRLDEAAAAALAAARLGPFLERLTPAAAVAPRRGGRRS